MGLRFRKSVNLGCGFRVNVSKSGVGYSWGIPGYRITKTAKGKIRKTYSIPKTGISYVSESPSCNTDAKEPIHTNSKTLDAGDISEYQSAEFNDLISEVENYKKWNLISNILICTIAFSCLGIILKIYVKKQLSIPINYSFDTDSKSKYENMKAKWNTLSSSRSLWQLTTSSDVKDKKRNAGATSLVTRNKIKIFEATPYFFKTDEKFITMSLKNETLYFMPDKILIVKGQKIGAIKYDDVKITGRDYHFIENQSLPSDATIIDYTWLKVNKDGSPDKRFNGNKKIPVCNYGLITITSNSGMDIQICISNNSLINTFK